MMKRGTAHPVKQATCSFLKSESLGGVMMVRGDPIKNQGK